jgi:hypothetical protein
MKNIIEIIKIRVEIFQNPYLQIKTYSPFVFLFLRIYFITVRSKLTSSFCRAGGNIHGRKRANNTGRENRPCVLETLVYEANKGSLFIISSYISPNCRSQWPRGLRRRFAAARLLRSWLRIPPGGMDVCLLWLVCCQVEVSATSWSLVQRVPPTVVRRCV